MFCDEKIVQFSLRVANVVTLCSWQHLLYNMKNCCATAWVWWISPALKHVQGWRLPEALLCGPGCISFFFCSPSLASFTYPSFTTWPGPSKAVHPTNAIYHKTQRHLIAPLQMAPAAQISLQHWSSGSQQSLEVLSRFLACNPHSTSSLLGTSMLEAPVTNKEETSKLVQYWYLGANWPRRKEKHLQADGWMYENMYENNKY